MEDQTRGAPCDGCGGSSRRDFLRDAAAITAAALATLGVSPLVAGSLRAMPIVATAAAQGIISYAVPAQDGVHIDRKNEVVLTRWQASIYAFSLACPHQKTALRWIAADSRFQCPKHKSKYQPDGTFISGKATRGMDRHAIRMEGGTILVDTDVLHRQDRDPDGWKTSAVKVSNAEK